MRADDASYKPLPTFLAFLNFNLSPTTINSATVSATNTTTAHSNKQVYRAKEVYERASTTGVYCDHRVIDKEKARGQNYEDYNNSGRGKDDVGVRAELISIPMVRSAIHIYYLLKLYYTNTLYTLYYSIYILYLLFIYYINIYVYIYIILLYIYYFIVCM